MAGRLNRECIGCSGIMNLWRKAEFCADSLLKNIVFCQAFLFGMWLMSFFKAAASGILM
jgi:hypothetical protein